MEPHERRMNIMNSAWLVIFAGLLLPFVGTTLGSAMIFFMKNEMNEKLQKALLGFASGVMIAASVWSLLIPSIEMAEEQNVTAWIPAAGGFVLGMMFLLVLDTLIPHLHIDNDKPEGVKSNFGKSAMLVLAVTLHNIPEGMAVGVVFAGLFAENNLITLSGALALALGIAIQNFPEGAIVSMPMVNRDATKGKIVTKPKAFLYGTLSGLVEPIFGFITILITGFITPVLPYFLSFAAGAMIYVVVEELIPESQSGEHTNIGTIGVALGFALMMILDVALG